MLFFKAEDDEIYIARTVSLLKCCKQHSTEQMW